MCVSVSTFIVARYETSDSSTCTTDPEQRNVILLQNIGLLFCGTVSFIYRCEHFEKYAVSFTMSKHVSWEWKQVFLRSVGNHMKVDTCRIPHDSNRNSRCSEKSQVGNKSISRVWGCDVGVYEQFRLLRYNASWSVINQPFCPSMDYTILYPWCKFHFS